METTSGRNSRIRHCFQLGWDTISKSYEGNPREKRGVRAGLGRILYARLLLGSLCVSNEFSGRNWKWTSSFPVVHIYCHELWVENYIKFFYEICEQFFLRVYEIIFQRLTPILSINTHQAIKPLGN